MASELEFKPQGKLSLTVVKATSLKHIDLIGKPDPYAVVYIRPKFKLKTKAIKNNLNPVWNETFQLIAEDKETQSVIIEVIVKAIFRDKRLSVAKFPLIDLQPETMKEIELRLLPALEIDDKKDRGTVTLKPLVLRTLKVLYHQFNEEEQLAALEEENRIFEQRKKLKKAGLIGSTMDATSLVGSGIGLVGKGIGEGVGQVGSGVGAVVGLVGSGVGAVGIGVRKVGKFISKSMTGQSSRSSKESGASTPAAQENINRSA